MWIRKMERLRGCFGLLLGWKASKIGPVVVY
jgi:hypothetical protein